ncbi:MAG TPA: nucleotidyltransferase domain-containing protein [Tepidisphaeraceae bacterium]|jgi:predicted nucleotidyltransferase
MTSLAQANLESLGLKDLDGTISAFCLRWRISRFSFFGSILREDFGPGSDVDVLVDFLEHEKPSLLQFAQMQAELESLFHRKVDLLDHSGVEQSRNPYRRQEILATAEIAHAG